MSRVCVPMLPVEPMTENVFFCVYKGVCVCRCGTQVCFVVWMWRWTEPQVCDHYHNHDKAHIIVDPSTTTVHPPAPSIHPHHPSTRTVTSAGIWGTGTCPGHAGGGVAAPFAVDARTINEHRLCCAVALRFGSMHCCCTRLLTGIVVICCRVEIVRSWGGYMMIATLRFVAMASVVTGGE